MVIKLYISGISGNKEVKKKQQRVQMILDSKQISYEAIDITEPGKEKDKEFMQQNGKVRESLGKYPLPPQIFNDDDFCGDYEDFDMANEVDELEKFLHIETSSKDNETEAKQDEELRNFKSSNHSNLSYNPYEYHTFKISFDDVNGMKEEIVNVDLSKENEQTEEVTKSEVNGESEAVPALDPSSENVTENVETPDEVAPEKEEGSTQDDKTNDETAEKESEEIAEGRQEAVEESQEREDEGKEEEKEEEKEEAENPKDEEVESPKEEERSPPPEEEQPEGDNEGEKSEKEENESESEPQPEKSQEE